MFQARRSTMEPMELVAATAKAADRPDRRASNTNSPYNTGTHDDEIVRTELCFPLLHLLPMKRKSCSRHQSIGLITDQPSKDDTEESSNKDRIIEEENTITSDDHMMSSGFCGLDNDDENSYNVDNVDLVASWGEEECVAFARSAYSLWLPANQKNLIEIFLREGFEIAQRSGPGPGTPLVRLQLRGPTGVGRLTRSGYEDGASIGLIEGEGYHDSSNDRENHQGCWPNLRKKEGDLKRRSETLKRGKSDTSVRIVNQRGDTGEVCKALGVPLYLEMDLVSDETTLADLKRNVETRWGTPQNQQYFYLSVDGVETTKEINGTTNGDSTKLDMLGVRIGSTIYLRDKKREGSCELREGKCLPIYLPHMALYYKVNRMECPFPSLTCVGSLIFDEADPADDSFRPSLAITLNFRSHRAFGYSFPPTLAMDAKLIFGNEASLNSDPYRRGYFVHKLDFVLRMPDGSCPTMLEMTPSTDMSPQREFGRETIEASASCYFDRRLWSPMFFRQHFTYYDEMPKEGNPQCFLPRVNRSSSETLTMKWKVDPTFDFLNFLSVHNWLPFLFGSEGNSEDEASVIIETKILMRKIHVVEIPTSDKGTLWESRWKTQNVDSYREVIIREKIPVCRFPGTGATLALSLVTATIISVVAVVSFFFALTILELFRPFLKFGLWGWPSS